MDSINKIIKETGINFTGSTLGNILGYIWLMVMTRIFSQEDFGNFTLAQSIINISLIFVLLGMHRSLDRFIPFYNTAGEPGKIKSLLNFIFVFAFSASVVIGLLLYIGSDYISIQIYKNQNLAELFPIIILSLPPLAVLMIVNYAFSGYKELRYNVYLKQLLEPVLKISFALLITLLGFSIIEWTWFYDVALFVTAVVGVGFLAKKIIQPLAGVTSLPIDIREILSYSWPISIAGVLVIIIGQFDFLILGFYHPAANVGIYRIYIQIIILLKLIQGSVARIYKPVISELIPDQKIGEIREIYRRISQWILMLTSLGLIVIIIYGSRVIGLFFTEAYVVFPVTLSILTLGTFLNSLFGPEGMTLEAFGNTKLTMINSLVMVILNIGLGFWLVPEYGMVGAAFATGIAMSVGGLIGFIEIYFLYDMQPFSIRSIKIFLVTIATGTAFYLIESYLVPENVFFLICSIILLTVVYGAGLYAIGTFDAMDKDLINKVFSRVRSGN